MGANAHVARVLTARVSFEDLCVLISFAYVDGGGRTNALPFVRARGAKIGFAIDEGSSRGVEAQVLARLGMF